MGDAGWSCQCYYWNWKGNSLKVKSGWWLPSLIGLLDFQTDLATGVGEGGTWNKGSYGQIWMLNWYAKMQKHLV